MWGGSQSGFCHLEIFIPSLLTLHPFPGSCLQGPTKRPPPSSPKVPFFPAAGVPPCTFFCIVPELVVGSFFPNRILFEDAGLGLHKELIVLRLFCLRFLPLTFACRLIMSFLVPFPFSHCSSSNKAILSFLSSDGNLVWLRKLKYHPA